MRIIAAAALVASAAALASAQASSNYTASASIKQGLTGVNITVDFLIYFNDAGVPTVKIENFTYPGQLPTENINYHIHQWLIPSDGDCYKGVDQPKNFHYDPFNLYNTTSSSYFVAPTRGNYSTYEIGDLSGKYGPINVNNTANFPLIYPDATLLLRGAENITNIIGRSIVLHSNTLTAPNNRLACANLTITRLITPPRSAATIGSAPATFATVAGATLLAIMLTLF